MSSATYEAFTAQEVVMMLEDIGYRAEVHEDEEHCCVIRSRCEGIAWQVNLVGQPPFHFGLRLKLPLLVSSDPVIWANDWNRTRFSQAFAPTDADTGSFLRDENGLAWVNVESLILFDSGVTTAHVVASLVWWVEDVLHIHSIPEVTYFEELPK
jgi:hypothetical protein